MGVVAAVSPTSGAFIAIFLGAATVADFDFVATFFTAGVFVAIAAFALGFLGAAFVACALVGFFAISVTAISMSSGMTFFGLPLFFATSADMVKAN